MKIKSSTLNSARGPSRRSTTKRTALQNWWRWRQRWYRYWGRESSPWSGRQIDRRETWDGNNEAKVIHVLGHNLLPNIDPQEQYADTNSKVHGLLVRVLRRRVPAKDSSPSANRVESLHAELSVVAESNSINESTLE